LLSGFSTAAMSIFRWNLFYVSFFVLGLAMYWLKIVTGNLMEQSYVPGVNEKIVGVACASLGFLLNFLSAPAGIVFALVFLGISLSLFGGNSASHFLLPTVILVLFGLNEHFYEQIQQLLQPISRGAIILLIPIVTTLFTSLGVTISAVAYKTLGGALTDGYLINFHDLRGQPTSVLLNPPCSGIEGVILYTIVCLLILPNLPIKRDKKIVYGVVGFAGAILINIVRILAIFIAGILWGLDGVLLFHKIGYGFFLVWSTMFWYVVSKRTLQGEGNASQFS